MFRFWSRLIYWEGLFSFSSEFQELISAKYQPQVFCKQNLRTKMFFEQVNKLTNPISSRITEAKT